MSVRDFRFSKNPTREKNRALVGYHKELFLVGNASRGQRKRRRIDLFAIPWQTNQDPFAPFLWGIVLPALATALSICEMCHVARTLLRVLSLRIGHGQPLT